jgi:ribonucleotide monophosphatase NagD (HAD superfamily)
VNITQLRETIVSLLSASPNLIGDYLLPDGQQIPAVYVVGRQGVPPEWKAVGLEITIEEFPLINPSPALGKFQRRKQWAVMLVNYDTDSTALNGAIERMAARFPDARFSTRPETDILYGQSRIVIPDVDMGYLAR